MRAYVYEDQSFPKGFDLEPCKATITRIKLLDQKLDLLYRRTTKQQPQELFDRKTQEAKSLPDYSNVAKTLEEIKSGIEGHLAELEVVFSGSAGRISVRSEKSSPPEEKKVSVCA